MPKRLTTVAGVALVMALAAAALVAWRGWDDRSRLEQAASYAPGDAQRLSWTDWAGVRERVDPGIGAASSATEVGDFLDRGYEKDLTSASALVQSAPVLQTRFGFSPASAEWELFSQADDGAVVIIGMPEDTDFDDIAAHLEENGFDRPDSDTGVWAGGDSLMPSIGSGLSPEVQYVALDAERHLVLTGDNGDYLGQVVDRLGEGELPDGVQQAVEATGHPLSAAVYSGEQACSALAMSQADPTDERQADLLVAEAGGVNPMTGFTMSVQPEGDVRVVMSFENDEQARANARSRAALAAGPAPGQGGAFTDRVELGDVTADGNVVRMDLRPRPGAYVFSDLSNGPVLFATC